MAFTWSFLNENTTTFLCKIFLPKKKICSYFMNQPINLLKRIPHLSNPHLTCSQTYVRQALLGTLKSGHLGQVVVL